MGMNTEKFLFQEMISTDDWALDMINKPALGILFLYQCTPVQTDAKELQAPNLKPEDIPSNVFYMKQYAQNACGTIGLFHIVLNALESQPDLVAADSFLSKFRGNAQNGSAEERGEIFKNSKDILSEHKAAVEEGQSSVQDQCDSHFISFVPKNGRIYELDGMKKCPVDQGACTQEEFLSKGAALIKEYMARDPDNINFSMIVLAAKPE